MAICDIQRSWKEWWVNWQEMKLMSEVINRKFLVMNASNFCSHYLKTKSIFRHCLLYNRRQSSSFGISISNVTSQICIYIPCSATYLRFKYILSTVWGRCLDMFDNFSRCKHTDYLHYVPLFEGKWPKIDIIRLFAICHQYNLPNGQQPNSEENVWKNCNGAH